MKKVTVIGLKIFLAIGMYSAQVQASTIILGPIVRNANNSINHPYMSLSDAKKYCKDMGKSLPTVKEFALALNPRGVRKTPAENFDKIKLRGEPSFYYNHRTYVRPSGDYQDVYFWSSSVDPEHNYSGAYVFVNGVILYDHRYVGNAVLCVSRR